MAILQALLSLIGRSAGKILNAVFGWAVRALFGFTTGAKQTLLTALVASAAVWPILLLGIALPRVAAFALAFVPIPKSAPQWIVRAVWIALAVIVPGVLGIALATQAPPDAPAESFAKRVVRGYPMTLGLAIAFWMSFVSVPVLHLLALARGWRDAHVPLVTDRESYADAAARARRVLNDRGFGLVPTEPGFWVRAPSRVLAKLGGRALRGDVPEHLAYFQGSDFVAALHSSGLLLRGPLEKTALAHGLVAEALAKSDALETTDPDAQALERQIQRVWRVLDENPPAHRGSPWLLSRLGDIGEELVALEIEYDDWQILYRKLLQLARALDGEGQLLLGTVPPNPGDTEMQSTEERPFIERPRPANGADGIPTAALIREIGAKATLLARKEIDLARVELRKDFESELAMVKGLAVAAVFGITTLTLLFVAGAFALGQVVAGWIAALILAGVALVIAAIAGLVGWHKRVTRPLEKTQRTLQEDVRWARERLA